MVEIDEKEVGAFSLIAFILIGQAVILFGAYLIAAAVIAF